MQGNTHLEYSGGFEVPRHSIEEFGQKKSIYCCCIFVINEGERIISQLKKMRPFANQIDLIIADGGSSDDSLQRLILQECGVRTLLTKTDEGGLSAQMRMAFSYSLKEGYQGIVTIDGNNKDDPAALPLFVDALEQGFDHLQGSRFITGGKAINTPFIRWLAIRLIHAPVISLSSGHWYTDTTNGFRAYSRRFLMDKKVAPFRSVFQRYELHYYLAIRAAQLGYRVKELPVTREYPRSERIPTKISPIKGNLKILAVLMKAAFHRFNPKTS